MKRKLKLIVPLALGVGCMATDPELRPDAPVPVPGPDEVVGLRLDLVELLISRKAPDSAVPLLRQVLHDRPDSARAHTLLGVVLRDKGLRKQAEAELTEAVRLDPRHVAARVALGVLYDQMRRIKEAERQHREATVLAPGCVVCWNNLGFSLFLAGRDREAVAVFEQALRLDPSARVAANNLGFVYARLGDKEAALHSFRLAVGEEGARRNLALASPKPQSRSTR